MKKCARYSVLIVGLFIVVAFQNCTGTKFSNTAGSFTGTSESAGEAPEAVPSDSQNNVTPIAADSSILQKSATQMEIDVFVMRNGVKSKDMYIDEPISAEILNSSKDNTWGCFTVVARAYECDNASVWGRYPTEGWVYNEQLKKFSTSQRLDMYINASQEAIMFVHDRTSDQKQSIRFTLKPRPVAAAPTPVSSSGVFGPVQSYSIWLLYNNVGAIVSHGYYSAGAECSPRGTAFINRATCSDAVNPAGQADRFCQVDYQNCM